jgi:hypothetical protein
MHEMLRIAFGSRDVGEISFRMEFCIQKWGTLAVEERER